jgi:diguanylate cyclase (GGDEF)-like protein
MRKQTKFETDEEKRIAVILYRIILATLGSYIVVVMTAIYWNDRGLMRVILAASLLLVAPTWLLSRGRVRLGALLSVLLVVFSSTAIAVFGQGIHDLAIMSYPVIIVLASMILRRRDFFIASGMVLAGLAFLVFGEYLGVFTTQPYKIPNAVDFAVVAAVIALTVAAVDMLAENTRTNIRQAHQEIARRITIEAQLRHQSVHDALTGIYNRAFFEEELARLEKGREYPVSILVADLDDLKVVNDRQGHAVGDELLCRTAELLRSVFRAGDVLARIGGDEFAVLLPRTDAKTVAEMLGRVQAQAEEYNAQVPRLQVKISTGISTAVDGSLVEALVTADQRMYANKAERKARAARSGG